MNKLTSRIVTTSRLFQVVVWLGVCSYVQAAPKGSSAVYELTVKAWAGPGFEGESLQIHQLVQPNLPFSFITNGQQGRLSVTGTLREENPDHFFLELNDSDAFEMSMSSPRMCDSQETEGEFGCFVIMGPGFQINLKRSVMEPLLKITFSEAHVLLAWPTSFTLQSSTNLDSPIWTTNLPAPVVVNGQNTMTNPISGTQKFFRLSQ